MPEVQTKDKAHAAGSEEPRGAYTYDELKSALETDPALRAEFMQNEDKFITVSDNPPAAEPKPQGNGNAQPGGDEAVSVLVKPSWLGSYAKNRKPDEAIQEMAKGNVEKDKTITFFKDEKIPALETELQKANEERATLKQQIADFEKKLQDAGGKPAEKPETKEVKIPDLPEDDLFYTEEGQKKIKDYLVAINQDRDNLRNELKSITEKVGDIEQKTETVAQDRQAKDAVKMEFEAIDNFRKENPAVFKSARNAQDIEKDYVGFMKDMASVQGIEAFAKDGSGRFSKEASDALHAVIDENSEDGKAIREKLQERNIKLPDDFGELQMVYAIRDIRSQTFEKNASGEAVPIPYNKAFKIYQGSNGDELKKMLLDARKDGHENFQKAVDERKRFAKETPLKGGAGPIDVDNYPTEQFFKLIEKGAAARTDEEDDILRHILKAKNLSDNEIDRMLAKPAA